MPLIVALAPFAAGLIVDGGIAAYRGTSMFDLENVFFGVVVAVIGMVAVGSMYPH